MSDADNKLSQCPVCHMMVDESSLVMEYKKHIYAFCSQQCRERFEANPNLYVGYPAPKKHGHEIIKKRKLKLSMSLTDDQRFVIESELVSMMGIKAISFELGYLSISYDLLQATAEQIESAIEHTGNSLGYGLGEKLKQDFIHYIEESELDNLEQTGHGHQH